MANNRRFGLDFIIGSRIAAGFNRSIRVVTDNLNEINDAADKLSSGAKFGLGLVAGAGALAAGFLAVADAVAESDVKIQSLSKSVGMNVDDVEALGSAVGAMGMDYEAIIDLREEFNNKMGESIGMGEAIGGVEDSFAILKLSYEEISKLKPEEQWNRVTDAILKHGNAAEASSAADILLGGEANKTFGFLKSQGVSSLSDIINKHKELSVRTDESRAGSVAFYTAMGSLKTFLGSLGSEIIGLTGGALVPFINKMVEWVKANKDLVKEKITQFVEGVTNAVSYLINNFSEIVGWIKAFGVGIAVFITLTTVLKTIVLVSAAWNVVMAANPITWIIIGVVALVAGIAILITRMGGLSAVWERVKGLFSRGFEFIKGIVASVVNTVKGIIGKVDAFFSNNPIMNFIFPLIGIPRMIIANWSSITGFFSQVWSGVVSAVSNGVTGVFNWVSNIFNSVLNFITGIWSSIKNTISGALSNIISGIASTPLFQTFTNLWNPILEFLSGLKDKMLGIGSNIIKGLIDGIKSGFEGLKSIWNTVNSWIPDFAKKKMDINSPSRVMSGIGGHIVDGLGVGINSGFPNVKNAMDSGLSEISKPVPMQKQGQSDSVLSVKPLPVSTNTQQQPATPSLQITQNITVGNGSTTEQAKELANQSFKQFESQYNAFMSKKMRVAY